MYTASIVRSEGGEPLALVLRHSADTRLLSTLRRYKYWQHGL